MYVHNEDQKAVLVALDAGSSTSAAGASAPVSSVLFSFTFENVLAPGRYSPVVSLAHRGSGLDVMDRFEGGFSFVVTGDRADGRDRRSPDRSRDRAGGHRRRAGGRGVSALESVPYEALGRPIRGPEALTGDWRRFWHLTFNIARTEWKLRFFGSALGYFWQLVRPLLLFGVLYVFFTKIGHVGQARTAARASRTTTACSCSARSCCSRSSPRRPEARSAACVDNEALVRKIQFPRMVIPLSVVLLRAVQPRPESDRRARSSRSPPECDPMLSWLELPLIVALLAVFATGLAMLLSALFVYFRDVRRSGRSSRRSCSTPRR